MRSEAPRTTILSVLEAFAAALSELFGRRAPAGTASLLMSSDEINAAQEEMRRIREYDEAAEQAMKAKHRDAEFIRFADLQSRAVRLGVAVPLHTPKYLLAEILDTIENPNAPTLLRDKHTFMFSGLLPDGSATISYTHPVNRAAHKISSREYPSSYPPERNDWTAQQWREFEQPHQPTRNNDSLQPSTAIHSHSPKF